jgi:hypothetical protein
MLEKLCGKIRPPLPPRAPSTQASSGRAGLEAQNTPRAPAALPDPEAQAEEAQTGAKVPSENEKIIIFRLLQAVLLEILDEYLSSLSGQDYPTMSWTVRLREKLEPGRVLPRRVTETQSFTQSRDLQAREILLQQFDKLGLNLGLDIELEVKKLIHPDLPLEDDPEQETSEYPTKPSQIPFPRAGVIFFHAYRSYTDTSDKAPLLSLAGLAQLVDHSFPLSAAPMVPLPALQDALLSLLYRHALAASQNSQSPLNDHTLSPAKFLLLLSTLTQLFTITPWPSLRDSAHHIATKLLHAYTDQKVRLQVIMQTLQGTTLSTNWAEIEDEPDMNPGIDEETGLTRSTSALQPHPIPLAPPQQLGALKAIGVDWLKEECLGWLGSGTQGDGKGIDPKTLTSPVGAGSDDKGLESPLTDLLFPREDLPTLDQSNPDSADKLENFLPNIPFYISTLNLLSLILPHIPRDSDTAFHERAESHIQKLASSLSFLTTLLDVATRDQNQGDSHVGGMQEYTMSSRADIFALQDACERARAVLEKHS